MPKLNCLQLAKSLIIFPLGLVLFFFLSESEKVYGDSTNTINLQGKIVRNDTGYEGLNVTTGSPSCVVSGNGNDTCDFRVRYYDATSGGTLLLTEAFADKEIGQYNGAFNLSLGSGSVTAGTYSTLDELVAGEDDVYVEIGFDPAGGASYTETFTRMPLQATAYAIRAKYASAANTAFRFDNATDSSGYISPLAGMVYFDTTESTLKVYDGSAWVNIGSGSGDSLWSDSTTFTYLTDTTDHLVLGSDTYTGIGTSDLSFYTAGLGSHAPFVYDMGAERLTLAGDTLRSGLTVYSDYTSTGAWPLVMFKAEDSGFDNAVLEVVQDGTGALAIFKKGSTEVFSFENEMTFFVRPRDTDPTRYENRIYNVNGTLYWNGTALATSAGSSLWTDGGTYTYLTSTTDDLVLGGNTPGTSAFFFDVSTGRLGIGTSTPSSSLDIAGATSQISNSDGDITISADESFVLKGNDVSNLTEWTDSTGTILSLINQNGYASFGASTSNDTAILSIGANTGTLAQINLASSSLDVSSPSSGDLWWNGNNLYFYDGSSMVDLLVGEAGSGADLFSENGSVANGGYLNVQHNADTYSVLADGWVCVGGSNNASCSGGNWKSIKEQGETIRHALKGDWEDADADGIVRTSIGDASVSIEPGFNPGTGADGDVTVQYNTNINATSLSIGRACADGGDAVNYNITAFPSSTTATLSSTPSVGCLKAGDEVLIINLQGTYTAMDNTGNYETLEVDNVSGSTITFKSAKKNYYGNGLTDDTNLGTAANTQRVMLQRVPNYKNLTVKSGVNFYPSSWNGVKGGVIFFRASESANINGEIDATGLGYRGGVNATITNGGSTGGEAFCGLGGTGAVSVGAGTNGAGGGGGYYNNTAGKGYCGGGGGQYGLGSENRGGAGGGAEYAAGGGGAGYGTAGGGGFSVSGQAESGGENTSGDGQTGAATYSAGGGGGTYGGPTLSKLFFGSAGAGGTMTTGSGAGPGGNGGGIIAISSSSLTISGSLKSKGVNGASASSGSGTGAGGGAGGSILLEGQEVNTGGSFVDVTGGTGGTGLGTSTWTSAVGGAGGHGRIAVYYADSYSGTTKNPTVTNYYSAGYNTYGMFVSPVVATPNAQTYDYIRWSQDLNTYGKIGFQTRSGNSTNPLDGTWEGWRPFTSTTNYLMLQSSDTHTQWTGTNATVSEGDTTRNVNFFEDEDESTATNITKVVSSTNGGYAETTISSTDLSNYDYLTAWVRASQVGNTIRLGMGESAGTEQYEEITVDTSDTWQKVYWDLSDIASSSKDGVTKIRLTNFSTNSNTIYVDNVRAEKLNTSNDGTEITSTPNNYIQYRAIFTTTDLAYKPVLRNVNISYNSGYQIVIYDNNNVRLYNHTGNTKYLKLDVTAGGTSSASGNGFVAGVAVSTVADGDGAVAFTFNTPEVYNNPTSKLFSVMNNSVEKMYLDAQGNLYVSGSIISGKGMGSVLTNNSGSSVVEKTLVTVDPTMNNAFTTTTVPNNMGAFGVVTGVSVNGDVNSNGVCDNGDSCMVVFEGITDVLTTSATSASVGDYIYSSTTAGQAKRSAELENGMIGVVSSVENAASGHLKMVFNSQNKISADLYLNVGFDKNAYRDIYTLLAKDYESKSLAERRGLLEENQSESVMFDTFIDGLKMNSSTSDTGLDTDENRMGLWGGLSIDGSTTDMAGNRYFGSSTATLLKSFYYDRTQSGKEGQDSTPETLVDLGIDPSWYNGVSLQTTNHISTSYNGNLIAVTGTYGTGSEHGALDITVTGSSVTGLTANIVSTDGSCSVTGATLNFNTDYEFRAGSCSGSTIGINVKRAEFNSGDKFRVASWLVEPETVNDRGEGRVFPQKSLILASRDASNGYLTIVDADTQLVWMKFTQSSTGEVFGVSSNSSMSSIAMINGELSVGMNGSSATGMYSIQFNTEKSFKYSTTGKSISNKVLSDRNIANTYSLVNASEALVSNIVNDVSSNVVWNKPTQETTVTGWGYIQGNGTQYIQEDVFLPYNFNSVPVVVMVAAGQKSSTPPTKLSDCSSYYNNFESFPINQRTNRVLAYLNSSTNFSSSSYYCYTWTATGSVSPKQFSALATGSATADGAATVINETDKTVSHVQNGTQHASILWASKVALTDSGNLYSAYNNETASSGLLMVHYNAATMPSDAVANQQYNGLYGIGTTSSWSPTIRGASSTNKISSLVVTEGTSTVDNSSNTIYVGTELGVSVIQEKQSHIYSSTLHKGLDEKNGSVKYYTKDYISEQMVGDIRGMWPLNYDNTSADNEDISVKANSLTAVNITSADAVSGVRGTAVDFNGTDEYLYRNSDSDFDLTTTVSMSAWVKTSTSGGYFFERYGGTGGGGSSTNAYYRMAIISSKVYLYARDDTDTTGQSITGNTVITDGNWHHVVGLIDKGSSVLSIYVDGVLETSATLTETGTYTFDDQLYIGVHRASDGNFSGYMNGVLDEPMISGSLLSSSQIKSMYESGLRSLNGSHTSADTYNQLNGSSNDVRDILVTPDSKYMYVGTEGGGISKIDLTSSTRLNSYTTATDPSTSTNNIETLSGRYYPVFAGDIGSSGAILGIDANGNDATATYYSNKVTFVSPSNKGYLWLKAYIDPNDTNANITVSASNDGGATYVVGSPLRTVGTGNVEYEYSFDFDTSDDEYIVKIELERDSSKKSSIYLKQWGLAQMDISSGTGNGIMSETEEGVVNGAYLEVVHGQNTYNILATGWVYDEGLAKWVKTADSSISISHNKNTDWLKDAEVSTTAGTSGDINLGDGSDGDITVSTSTNINRTSLITGRSCADGGDAVNYNILSFNSAGTEATLNRAPSVGCIASGDEVLVINLAGTNSAMDNVGNYETLIVDSVSGSTITFETAKTKYYGNNLDDDSNLGVVEGTQRVMLQRVPNYEDVRVNSSINFYPDEWATESTENATYRVSKGGVMFFRASGNVNINGTIYATGKGYQGGTSSGGASNGGGQGGEAFCGIGGNGANSSSTASNGAAGGGAYTGIAGNGYCGGGGGGATGGTGSVNRGGAGGGGGAYAGGGGGGYGTPGTRGGQNTEEEYGSSGGQNSSGNGCSLSTGGGGGGGTYNDASLDKLMFGSGGGRGGNYTADSGGFGGDGGGIVLISASTITVSGDLESNGNTGSDANFALSTYAGGGGGGAAGSIRLEGADINIGTYNMEVEGGRGGSGENNNTVIANGGTGGSGRMAVYYSETFSGTVEYSFELNTYELDDSSTPSVDTVLPDGIIRTAIGLSDISLDSSLNLGDGSDGDITVSSDTNINRTSLITGRSCADGGDAVNYNILSFNSAGTEATLNRAPSVGCIASGDEVLVINLAGTNSAMDNVGNYETLIVDSVSGSTITFETAKTKYYGNNLDDDTNLGVAEGTQRVMLQRVPNYEDVTVNSSINFYPDEWATESAENATYRVSKGGVMFFRASGSVNVNGTIHANGKGYQGGTISGGVSSSGVGGHGGEAYCGTGGVGTISTVANNGSAGGGSSTSTGGNGYCGGGGGGATGGAGSVNRGGSGGAGGGYAGAGGGGYGTPGTGGSYTSNAYGSNGGINSSGNGASNSSASGGGGGGTYNDASLDKLMFGSGGGRGGNYTSDTGGVGGDGGGAVYIAASAITVSGTLTNNGVNGGNYTGNTYAGGGGGGAGGSIRLEGVDINIGSSKLTVTGGSAGTGVSNNVTYVNGGVGGSGRVAVYYSETYSGTSGTPAVTNTYEGGSYTYGMYHSNVIPTIGASSYSDFRWNVNNNNYGQISIQTRTGASNDPTDGTWEEWKPAGSEAATLSLNDSNDAASWIGTNATVSDGDTTRNIDFFEDEDEATGGNITKLESSTNGGYAESTITSKNLSSYDYITAWVKSSVTGQSLSLGIGESVSNEQTEKVYVDSVEWQKVYWDITDVASANKDGITKLRITNTSSTPNTFYIDNVKAEKLPTSGLDSIHSSADDYLQYRVVFTTTDIRFKPQFSSISFTYNIGYDIVQIDANTVRMYNYSGSTKKLRLDIVTGGLIFDLSQGSSTSGSVNIAPQMAQIDDSGMNSIWINKTVAGGNLLKLQTLGADAFVVNYNGDTVMAGDIQVQGGNLELGTTGSIRFNESSGELEFTNDGTSWIALGSTFTSTILSAEYAGAVFSADGSSNTGNMIADNEGTSANSMNYYEWNSSESTLNDYDIRIRFSLPSDFDTWGASGGIRLNFATEATGTTNNQVDFYVYKEDSATIDGSSEDQASSSAGVWTSTFISGATLDECASAGDVCVLVIKMSSANDNYVRVGDIEIGYDRKL